MADRLKFIKESIEYLKINQKRKTTSKADEIKPPRDDPKGAVVRVHHFSNEREFYAKIKSIGGLASYIGIPAGGSPEERAESIHKRSTKFTSKRKKSVTEKERLLKKAFSKIALSNAYLLFLFSKGQPHIGQPPRLVLEPAIQAPWNRKEIAALVALAVEAETNGQHYKARQLIIRAGARAARAAREWFDDPRNGWAPNAESVAKAKGFNKPGIDTESMRKAITHFEKPVSGTIAKVE